MDNSGSSRPTTNFFITLYKNIKSFFYKGNNITTTRNIPLKRSKLK